MGQDICEFFPLREFINSKWPFKIIPISVRCYNFSRSFPLCPCFLLHVSHILKGYCKSFLVIYCKPNITVMRTLQNHWTDLHINGIHLSKHWFNSHVTAHVRTNSHHFFPSKKSKIETLMDIATVVPTNRDYTSNNQFCILWNAWYHKQYIRGVDLLCFYNILEKGTVTHTYDF